MLSSLYPYFVKKRPISKYHCALVSILCQKSSHSPKRKCSNVIFSQFFHEKPPALKPVISQKTSILSKLKYIIGHKSQHNAFFFRFLRKNHRYHAIILSKKVHSLKNTLLSSPFFVKKRPFSKTR